MARVTRRPLLPGHVLFLRPKKMSGRIFEIVVYHMFTCDTLRPPPSTIATPPPPRRQQSRPPSPSNINNMSLVLVFGAYASPPFSSRVCVERIASYW